MDKNCYMIRRVDGEYFNDMPFHPYTTDGPDYTIEVCGWLYSHTLTNTTKNFIVDFVTLYCLEYDIPLGELIEEISFYPFPEQLIVDVESRDTVPVNSLDELDELISNSLNSEFLRARIGGRYDSYVTSNEAVFRISNPRVSWYNSIYKFVIENKTRIETVTVSYDKEATRSNEVIVYKGIMILELPVSEFLTLPGNPDF